MNKVRVKGQSKTGWVGQTALVEPYSDPLFQPAEPTETLGLSPNIGQGQSKYKKKNKYGWSKAKPQKTKGSWNG